MPRERAGIESKGLMQQRRRGKPFGVGMLNRDNAGHAGSGGGGEPHARGRAEDDTRIDECSVQCLQTGRAVILVDRDGEIPARNIQRERHIRVVDVDEADFDSRRPSFRKVERGNTEQRPPRTPFAAIKNDPRLWHDTVFPATHSSFRGAYAVMQCSTVCRRGTIADANWMRLSMPARRVLILDFDFFTTIGGGQVFFQRSVERNPQTAFFFPSRGADLIAKRRGLLPANAHPFACEADANRAIFFTYRVSDHWTRGHYVRLLCSVATAVQGSYFDVVEIPSFLPVADLVRPVFAAYGVGIGTVALALLGWMSASSRHAYANEADDDTIATVEAAERRSMAAADIRYAISDVALHQDWQTPLPIYQLDMHDTLERFPVPPPEPPGEGPPDIWYVGRLDRAKGPDLFVELVAQMPPGSYRHCLITGPDNEWETGTRWSEHVLALARPRGVDARYVGQLSNQDLRSRVFQGRSVVVIPSRTDTFNYVALEALLNGCPVLLSERTGAAAFLREHHPDICPPIIDPEDTATAGQQLRALLDDYAGFSGTLRQRLRVQPFPQPRIGFMDEVYATPPERDAEIREVVVSEAAEMVSRHLLMAPLGKTWRPLRKAALPRVSFVVAADDGTRIPSLLAQLTRQSFPALEILLVTGATEVSGEFHDIATSFGPAVRLLRPRRQDGTAAANYGVDEARGDVICLLQAGDGCRPELITESLAQLDAQPEAVGSVVDWDIVDDAGFVLETVQPGAVDPFSVLSTREGRAGPGGMIRTQVLRQIGGLNGSLGPLAEIDLWRRATALGGLVHIPRSLAFRHAGSVAPITPTQCAALAGHGAVSTEA